MNEIPWYVQVIIGLLSTIAIGFNSWLALSVISLRTKIVELESKVLNQEKHCEQRLSWLRTMEEKHDRMSNLVSEIHGRLLSGKD